MNMLEVGEKLKGFSQDQLIREMQLPTGQVPQFMVMSEITRRKRMADSYKAQQAEQGAPTVAEEVIASAGVPQQGLSQMASAMAPKSSMAQNTGIGSLPQKAMQPQGMYGGGPVRKMQEGGVTSDPALRALAAKMGITVDQLLRQQPTFGVDAARRQRRDRLLGLEPQGEGATFPTQADLDRRYFEDAYGYGPTMPSPPAEDAPFVPPSMVLPAASPMTAPQIDLDLSPDALPAGTGTNPAADLLAYSGASSDDPAVAADVEAYLRQAAAADMPPITMTGPAGAPPPDPRVVREREAMAASKALTDRAVALADAQPPSGPAGAPIPEGEPGIMQSIWDTVSNATLSPPDWFASMFEPEQKTPEQRREEVETGITPAVDPASAPQPAPGAGAGVTMAYDAGGGSGGGSGGGGGGGSGGSTSGGYISELEEALKRAERTKEQDKWLALAQTGLALMASDQPTLGGAIGEAGQVGIGAFRDARDTYEKDRMALMQAIAGQKAAAAKAMGGGKRGGGGGGAPSIDAYLKGLDTDLSNMTTKDELGATIPKPGMEALYEELIRRQGAGYALKYGMPPTADFDATQ